MYIYCGKIINNPICIHFLCGCKYYRKNLSDKRNVIAGYIDSKEYNYSLILEKQFTFGHYKKMGLNDLGEIELFASHYASTIIVLHETNSTAAEIALFGSIKKLQNKILVIHPTKDLIEVDNIGTFLEFAYFTTDKAKKYSYNDFSTKLNKTNKHVRYYMTSFRNDILDEEIKEVIDNHVYNNKLEINVCLQKKNKYIKENYYQINRKNKKISVYINYQFVFSFILAVISNKKLQEEISDIECCITNTCFLIKKILCDTICNKEKLDDKLFKDILIKTTDKKEINRPVKFCINILTGIGLIKFKSNKIIFTKRTAKELIEYNDIIQEIDEKDFFNKIGDKNVG